MKVKVGDLVRLKNHPNPKPGIVVHLTEKKVWRTHLYGKKIDWSKIDPEPHVGIMWNHNLEPVNTPVSDVEVLNESG